MENQAAIIDALYTARKNGLSPSGLDEVEFDLEEALELQLGVLSRFEAAGEKRGGWKVGLTSGGARDRMGKDFRPFGYVLKNRILSSGSSAPAAKILNCSVEPELCRPLDGTAPATALAPLATAHAVRSPPCRTHRGKTLRPA